MILSYQTLKETFPRVVSPFEEEKKIAFGMSYGLSSAGYDVRIDLERYSNGKWFIEPGEFFLASTIEYLNIPLDMAAEVKDKSTWARKGLSAFNTFIDPGFNGFLTLELVNNYHNRLELHHGMPIVQIIFHKLDRPTEVGYSGKYQGQAKGPQEAILEGV